MQQFRVMILFCRIRINNFNIISRWQRIQIFSWLSVSFPWTLLHLNASIYRDVEHTNCKNWNVSKNTERLFSIEVFSALRSSLVVSMKQLETKIQDTVQLWRSKFNKIKKTKNLRDNCGSGDEKKLFKDFRDARICCIFEQENIFILLQTSSDFLSRSYQPSFNSRGRNSSISTSTVHLK